MRFSKFKCNIRELLYKEDFEQKDAHKSRIEKRDAISKLLNISYRTEFYSKVHQNVMYPHHINVELARILNCKLEDLYTYELLDEEDKVGSTYSQTVNT